VKRLTAEEIRRSFVNCSKGEAKRMVLPDLDATPWDDLDFLGWQDPSGSQRACLVVERDTGPVGLLLRQSTVTAGTVRRSTMCQVCVTPHGGQGVSMSVARKTGAAGRKGDSSGIYLCRDLACSLYIRGKKVSGSPRLRETLPVERQVERCLQNVHQFVDRVLAG
jgi:FBP C-terminal treble-clef zinc-finger